MLENCVSEYENIIDQMVYKIYRFTSDEIKVMEGNNGI